ncbi:hypothetical protein B0H14DRAFT_3422979 [Mycena olivaceomarginata]|nr:hypothetical protein B0H14DRAFT_3422979 [Mycena olivaceomarginata]
MSEGMNCNLALAHRCIVLIRLHDRTGLDLFDWPRLAAILGGLRFLRWVEFYPFSHKNWATQAITERLGRTYALRVNQIEDQYGYSLEIFDR